ncbi:hypothetical protein M3Y99_01024000 [Aphelenchoides fujianensis]|nr:hypothetical protein M3Y99_01024000 [Aphelenchoides fujianensis]
MLAAIADECLHSTYGLPECVRILPEHRGSVFCAGIRSFPAVEPQIRRLLFRFGETSADDPFLRRRVEPLVDAIGCLRDPNTQKFYVNAVLNNRFVPFGDLLLRRISAHDETRSILREVAEERREDVLLSAHYELFVQLLASCWTDKNEWKTFTNYWNGSVLNEKQKEALEAAGRTVEANARWNERDLPQISTLLLQHK